MRLQAIPKEEYLPIGIFKIQKIPKEIFRKKVRSPPPPPPRGGGEQVDWDEKKNNGMIHREKPSETRIVSPGFYGGWVSENPLKPRGVVGAFAEED